jgi:hypothetical protein
MLYISCCEHQITGGILWRGPGGNNTVALYEKAWIHVIDLFRAVNAPVTWQVDLNNIPGFDLKEPLAAFLPDQSRTEYWSRVDEIGVTVYNRAFLVPTRNFTQTFVQAFDAAYKEVRCALLITSTYTSYKVLTCALLASVCTPLRHNLQVVALSVALHIRSGS